MTAEERLRFIELRKREIDLARAMTHEPGKVKIWQAWYSTALQVDRMVEQWDPAERAILDDLSKVLELVYSGAAGIERLIEPRVAAYVAEAKTLTEQR